ncbi:phosphomethylpyrimidine synthase ThiC, partial [Candidatus Pacearchaeota archaeon]|nr:phosphomethylpyrimidine synthase ThiC [Candidatus Pacearchaeota archaeon]
MTQLEKALNDEITKEMRYVARQEEIDVNLLKQRVADGLIVIPANISHKNLKPIGIGYGLKTKVNANIGTSPIKSDLNAELKKLNVAIKAGADTVMDLSTSENLDEIRKEIIASSQIPIGTVPIYQATIEIGGPENLTLEKYLEIFEKNAKDGVDFATVHAGVVKEVLPLLEKRLMPVVSRGGSFLIKWMQKHDKQNFLYEHFDKILDIAREYDVTLSLGDGLRPGCIEDATDKAQIYELRILGELTAKARRRGVQVMVEGPGHIPLNEIGDNIKLEKKICRNAPFYVLGPLPTDIAAGYDHIACAIGGALAGMHGADFLCYVTPKEHIGLPNEKDVREGVIVTKIAAHIADIAK